MFRVVLSNLGKQELDWPTYCFTSYGEKRYYRYLVYAVETQDDGSTSFLLFLDYGEWKWFPSDYFTPADGAYEWVK